MKQEELEQYQDLKREIEQVQVRVRALEHAAEPGAQRLTGLPAAPGVTDRLGDYAAEIADLQAVIGERYRRCLRERIRLEQYISAADDSLTRQVLTLRFVDGLGYPQIARRLGSRHSPEALRQRTSRYLKQH